MHIFFCNDCLKVLDDIKDESIDLVLTDPPYGMNYQSNSRIKRHELIEGDDNTDWLKPLCEKLYRVLKDNTHLYMFCNDYNLGKFREELSNAGFNVKRTLIWQKNGMGMGDLTGDYSNCTEFIVFAHKGRRKLNGKREKNILRFNRVSSNRHPTEKPVDLLEFLIKKSTNPGDIVLDPFAGVCSTAEACSNTRRRSLNIELRDVFINIGKERVCQK